MNSWRNLRFWLATFCLLLVVTVALAQTRPTPRPENKPAGRFEIYYHPTNFNQALLLDTANGSVWRLVTVQFNPNIQGKEGEEIEYPKFERVGVEGLYKSAPEAISEGLLREGMQKLAEIRWIARERKRLASLQGQERQKKLMDLLPGLTELREIATQAESSLAFLDEIRDMWPVLRDVSGRELLLAIKDKHPRMETEFPMLFVMLKE